MSIQSWIKEFYAIPACDITNDIEATNHSLQKWKGALSGNLKKHELTKENGEHNIIDLYEHMDFPFNCDTCALCEIHFYKNIEEGHKCITCPISKIAPDRLSKPHYCVCQEEHSTFMDENDPKPMIELLEKTLAYLEENKNEKSDS